MSASLREVEAEVPLIEVEAIKSLDEARETILRLRNQLIGARLDIRLNLQRTEVIHSSLQARWETASPELKTDSYVIEQRR